MPRSSSTPRRCSRAYRLHYGIPGASHAFTIARRLGLPEECWPRAESYLGHGERSGLAVLERLQALRAALDEELQAAPGTLRRRLHEQDRQHPARGAWKWPPAGDSRRGPAAGERLLSDAEEQLKALFREARQETVASPGCEQARLTGSCCAPSPEAADAARHSLPGWSRQRLRSTNCCSSPRWGSMPGWSAAIGATVELEFGGKRLRQPLSALRQYQPPRLRTATGRAAESVTG